MWRPSHISSRHGVVLAVAALLAVAVVAARGRSAIPSEPGAGFTFTPREDPPPRRGEDTEGADSVLDLIGGVGVGLLLLVTGVMVLIGAIGVLVSFGLAGARRRRGASTPVRSPLAEESAAEQALALRAAVRAGMAELPVRAGGAPGDAVIAAWLVLEDAAAACGTRRAPAETASEFTTRVMAEHAVDGVALADLRSRYHRARFAGHASDDDDATAARAALARVEETLAGAVR